MEQVANDLVLTPFKEMVEKARIALESAGDVQAMQKSARTLVKEAERAVKNLEPLCKKHFAEYGSNYVEALRADDEIAEHRSHLTDLLWEFDDYLEPDDFDAEKFTELAAASRKAAPRLCEILRRMKLEPSIPPIDGLNINSPLSPPTSPYSNPDPLSPTSAARVGASHLHQYYQQQQIPNSLSIDIPPVDGRWTPRSSAGSYGQPRTASIRSAEDGRPRRRSKAPPPRPDSTDPWDIDLEDLMEPEEEGDYDRHYTGEPRRPPVGGDESPIDPNSPLPVRAPEQRISVPDSNSVYSSEGQPPEHEGRMPYARGSSLSYHPFPPQSPVPAAQRQKSNSLSVGFTTSIPEDEATHQFGPTSSNELGVTSSNQYHYSHPLSQASPIPGGSLSPLDARTTPQHMYSNEQYVSPPTDNPEHVPRADRLPDTRPPDGLEPVHSHAEQDCAPIPVDSEFGPDVAPATSQSATRDTAIGSASSFYLNKGFCDGAKQVLAGGTGVKKTKKPVGFATAVTVARCTGCLYELDFREMENDVKRLDKGTYTSSGISYRLRFLQKSHLATRRVDDTMYGCMFCVHEGKTVDESDATVFFSSKALMAHIARHPRPLPEIEGIDVVDEAKVPVHKANDFDLHFTRPPMENRAREYAAETAQLPSATAREQVRKIYGQRLLPDKSPAFEVAQGAKLLGVRWPAEYRGEWVFAWHDGQYASIPSELVKLNPPPTREIKMGRSSQIRAKARWKFSPRDKDGDWLKFERGEVITNISWQYSDHWCWSGTNSKGKWGIFPQVFIDSNTVQEGSATTDRANVLNLEKNRSLSVFSRFGSSRKGTGRPASIAESTSSKDTGSSQDGSQRASRSIMMGWRNTTQ